MREGPRSRAVAAGGLLGLGAGAALSFADVAGSWHGVSELGSQIELLPRTLALLGPLGVILGALSGLVALEGARAPRRLADLPIVLCAAPGLVLCAHLLFTGGQMSRIPLRPVLVAACAIALIAMSYAALRLARRIAGWSRGARRGERLAVVLLLSVAFLAVAAANQYLFSSLYDYLHALGAIGEGLVVALALSVGWHDAPRARALIARPTTAPALVLGSIVVLCLDLATLEARSNVQVALLDPRAPASRSAMQALLPIIARPSDRSALASEIARAREERRRRQQALGGRALPSVPQAHVLLVTIDALRADHLGLYGYRRALDGRRASPSPAIDAFAQSAVVFERAYAQAPHSSYSISTLMTGEYVHEAVELEAPLPTATLASVLEGAGYVTAGLFTPGIFHTEGEHLAIYRDGSLGFDRLDHTDYRCESKTDAALAEVDRIVSAGEPPSLIWAHYFDVHEPYLDTSLGAAALDRYDAEIRNVDRAFARLVREVDARFIRDVVVVLTADHGEELRDHGGVYHGSTLFEEQIRVPLVVRLPGVAPRRVARPVELVDVAPTVLGLLEVPRARSMRGDDLRGLLAGHDDDPGPAFSAVLRRRAVVRWPYKLVADLRFGTFQLYDLEHDPRERVNLAQSQRARVDALTGEIYAWLDSLGTPAGEPEADPRERALDRGRLGDRRAVPELGALVADESAPGQQRCQAARILGFLADAASRGALDRAMRSPDRAVAAEAAIALGRVRDPRARPALVALMSASDADVRTRAAVSLGRLRDPAAVPALVEALDEAEAEYDRQEAIRWLGRLRDPRGVEPLIALLSELDDRLLAVTALGMIGDRRAYDPLVELLSSESHQNIRDEAARALGQLGDPRALPVLVELARSEPELEQTAESLVRLRAFESPLAGGADAVEGPGLSGFARCEEEPLHQDWHYAHRTYCQSAGSRAAIRVRVPAAIAARERGAILLVEARRLDAPERVAITLAVSDRDLGRVEPDAHWTGARIAVAAGVLAEGEVTIALEAELDTARFALDHVLVLPSARDGTASDR